MTQVDFEAMTDEPVGEDQISRLAEMVARQRDTEVELKAAQDSVKALGERLRQVSEVDIPELLDEAGVAEMKLADGTRVTIKEDLRVSTTGKNRDPINKWLEANGHDDVIKDEVTASFGKGEGALAEKLVTAATGLTESVKRVRSVNPQTFAALLRELIGDGVSVPLADLGVFVQRRAMVK